MNYLNKTYNGTVVESGPFNANDDSARLYKAMKGIGTGIFSCLVKINLKEEISKLFKKINRRSYTY
jgi:hypothetical protein